MPYDYKLDTMFSNTEELGEQIRFWSEQGYEPFTILNIKQARSLSGVQELPVLVVRKLIRKSRKKKA